MNRFLLAVAVITLLVRGSAHADLLLESSTGSGSSSLPTADASGYQYSLSGVSGRVKLGTTTGTYFFVYHVTSNDWTLTAQISALPAAGEVGLLMQEPVTGGRQAFIRVNKTGQLAFQRRRNIINARFDASATAPSLHAGNWLRLIRSSHTIAGFYSADGQTWTQLETSAVAATTGVALESQTIPAANDTALGDVQVGLVATNDGAASPLSFTFHNVTLIQGPNIGSGSGLRVDVFANPDFTSLSAAHSGTHPLVELPTSAWTNPPPLPSNNFSVRWSGTLNAKYSDSYTLYLKSKDGVRLWLDGNLVIDDWIPRTTTTESAGTV